jgi:hypothetical protein
MCDHDLHAGQPRLPALWNGVSLRQFHRRLLVRGNASGDAGSAKEHGGVPVPRVSACGDAASRGGGYS